MNNYLRHSLIPILLLWSMVASAQDYEFRNSVDGIDICFPDRFQLELGTSNTFPLSVNGHDFMAEFSNSAQRVCYVRAKSYPFEFKDGESYRFIFSYRHKQKGLVSIDTKVTYRKPKLFSLSVGVNEASLGLPALKTAQKSAAEFNNATKSPWFFPQYGRGQSYLVSTGTESPVASNIEKRMGSIKGDMKDGDLFLFYFAGHGTGSDSGYSFVLGGGNLYSGESFASMLKGLPADSEKIVIVCSCYSRYLWQHLCENVPNVTFLYASKSMVQGDVYAEQLMLLLDRTRDEEMHLGDMVKSLAAAVPESGIFPLRNVRDYQVSYQRAPEPTQPPAKESNLVPAFLSVVPGAGQFYKHDYLKGSLIFGTAVASGIGVAVCETRRAKYSAQMSQTYDVQALTELSNRSRNYATGRNVCIAVASVALVYSIVDAAVAPSKKKVQITPTGLVYNF